MAYIVKQVRWLHPQPSCRLSKRRIPWRQHIALSQKTAQSFCDYVIQLMDLPNHLESESVSKRVIQYPAVLGLQPDERQKMILSMYHRLLPHGSRGRRRRCIGKVATISTMNSVSTLPSSGSLRKTRTTRASPMVGQTSTSTQAMPTARHLDRTSTAPPMQPQKGLTVSLYPQGRPPSTPLYSVLAPQNCASTKSMTVSSHCRSGSNIWQERTAKDCEHDLRMLGLGQQLKPDGLLGTTNSDLSQGSQDIVNYSIAHTAHDQAQFVLQRSCVPNSFKLPGIISLIVEHFVHFVYKVTVPDRYHMLMPQASLCLWLLVCVGLYSAPI